MTRKSKARYGINRTYKLNAGVKALRAALLIGLATVAVVPSAQAACTFTGNTITCSGAFGGTGLAFFPGDVTLPFDLTTIFLDNTTVINSTGNTGVLSRSYMDLDLTSDADIAVANAGLAVGISAVSYYGDVNVTNNGDISVTGGTAAGITSFAYYGDVSVTNNGTITASATGGTGSGIRAVSFPGDVSVENAGSITATSVSGQAFGIYAYSYYGAVDVENSGDITATSTSNRAFGIYAGSYYDDASVNNDGDIVAQSTSNAATGILAVGQNATITGSGDVTATTTTGAATGVFAFAIDSYGVIDIDVSGDVTAATTAGGSAIGIRAYSYAGDVYVTSAGEITASNVNGAAIGILTGRFGYAYVYNYGNITTNTTNGNSIGIQVDSFYGANITNSGDLTDSTTSGSARGIQALTTFDVAVYNSGDITASSVTGGSAQGIRAKSSNGYAYVYNSGDISATSSNANAISILATGLYGVEIINTGDLSADTDFAIGYGIYAQTRFGDAYVYSSGDITAHSYVATASGIYAKAGYDAIVANSGDISATSDYANGYGVYAYAQFGDAAILNSGDITVSAYYDSTGLFAKSIYGVAYISNSGDVSVSSEYGVAAYGLYASAFQNTAVVLNYGGAISTISYDSDASAIVAVAMDDVVIYNGGALNAYSYNGDAIGIVGTTINGSLSIYNTGDITAESIYGNAYGIYARNVYGDILVATNGDMTVTSYSQNALGIYAQNIDGDITIDSSGDLSVASTKYYAAGIVAFNYNGAIDVTNGGNISAESVDAGAYGIFTSAGYGDITITNSGDMQIASEGANVAGIAANAYAGAINIANTGDLTVDSPYGAAGIYATASQNDISISNNAIITATGEYATGIFAQAGSYVYSEYGGSLVLGDVSVTTGTASKIIANGTYASGMYLEATGNISVNNAGAITATGDYASGITAYAYGNVAISNSGAISANGDYAAGINTYAYNDVAVTNSGSILANSAGEYGSAIGIYIYAYGTATVVNSGSVKATGTDPWAISSYAETTTITNATTGKIFGAIETAGGADTFTNNGNWYAWDDNTSSFGDGNDAIVNSATGKIFMEGSSINLGYAEGSTNSFLNNGKLYAKGSGNTINMGGNGSVFTNNGASIHMEDGDTNDSLTIIGNFAGTGHVVVDANGTTMLADRLYIVGNVVAGTANVIDVTMANGPSVDDLLAGDVINIVNVTGTSAVGNFTTGVISIAQDELYTLQGGIVKNGGNFGLGFTVTGLSATGVLASSVSPAVQNLWNQGTGTLFQREGSHHPDEGATPDYKAGVWARYYGASGSVSPDAGRDNFGAGGSSNFDQDGSGWEVGVSYAFNNQWAVGLLGGGSESTIDPDAGGRAEIDGSTFGGYVTWTPGNGFYGDLSYRAMSFDGNGQGGQDAFGFKGDADGFNLELGYGFKSSEGLIVEPQFQYSFVSVDMDAIDYHSSDYRLTDGDSSLIRLGAAIRKSYATSGGSFTPYGAISYLDELDGNNNYDIGGLGGSVDTSGGSALVEAGVSGVFKGFGYSAGFNWRDGSAYDSVFGGQVSVRYDW